MIEGLLELEEGLLISPQMGLQQPQQRVSLESRRVSLESRRVKAWGPLALGLVWDEKQAVSVAVLSSG